MHCARMSSIDVGVVGPKGGDFELETIFDHHDDTEMRADRVGARKNFLDGLGRCIGGDIEIFWRDAAHDIPHATTGEIDDVVALPQTRGDFACRLFHRRCFHHEMR